MSADYQKQFRLQQKINYKTLKALIQKKREIRINFSNSKAYEMIQKEILSEYDNITFANQQQKMKARMKISKINSFHQKIIHHPIQADNIFQVVKRHRNKFAPIGSYQQKPLIRNIKMSRSFRKKRNHSSLLQKYKTLELCQALQGKKQQQHIATSFQNNHLCFLNNSRSQCATLDIAAHNKAEKYLKNNQPSKSSKVQYTQAAKRINLMMEPSKSLAQDIGIAFRLNKRFHYQSQYCNTKETISSKDNKFIDSLAQRNKQFQQNNDNMEFNSFLMKQRPPFTAERSRFTSERKRAPSRNKVYINFEKTPLPQSLFNESSKFMQPCRPWTSNKMGEQKGEERLSPKIVPKIQ